MWIQCIFSILDALMNMTLNKIHLGSSVNIFYRQQGSESLKKETVQHSYIKCDGLSIDYFQSLRTLHTLMSQ